MKVLGLDSNRNVVTKELTLSEKDGAILTYKGKSICIEPRLDYFNKLYRPWDGADGFSCAFVMSTNKCNKKCSYCYEQKMKIRHYGNPTVDELISITKDFIPDDLRGLHNNQYKDYTYDGIHPVIRIIGGEPTVFKELGDYLDFLVNERYNQIWVVSNGIALQNSNYFKKIPSSPRVCWSISIDWNTTDDFIRRYADNVLNNGNELSFSIGINDNDWKTGIHQDELIINGYDNIQEIRYRGISEQDGSKYCTASDVLDFITESRGIKPQTFIDYAKWHQQTLTCLNYRHTENPGAGNVIAARLPVWNTMLAEEYCKMSSFAMNTKRFWNTAEGHCASISLFIYRMKNHQRFNHPSHNLFWDKESNQTKVNPYTRKGYKREI